MLRFDVNVPPVGKVEAISVMHFGAEGTVALHAYAAEDNFQDLLPTFSAINDSFRYDPDFTFTPGAGRSPFAGVWEGAGRGAVMGAVGGVVAAVVLVVVRVVRRPKPKPE